MNPSVKSSNNVISFSVLRGSVSALNHNRSLQRTEITVRARRVIRDVGQSLEQTRGEKVDPTADYYVLHRPLKCGTKSGGGEYLFVGRWQLGYPVVTCAPRYSRWKKMRRKARSLCRTVWTLSCVQNLVASIWLLSVNISRLSDWWTCRFVNKNLFFMVFPPSLPSGGDPTSPMFKHHGDSKKQYHGVFLAVSFFEPHSGSGQLPTTI